MNGNRTVICLLPMLIFSVAALGQFEKNYKPIPAKDTVPAEIAKALKSRLEADKKQALASSSSKNVGKYKCSLYERRCGTVLNLFNSYYFMIDPVLTPYLQNIAKKIYQANPELPAETRIFAYRSTVPNAISFGEGTIAINLGLLSRLENEDQLAFVICHELAHYHQKHSDNHIHKIAELNYDKDLEKQLKEIKESEYNQYSKTMALLQELTFDVTRHSRIHENEADSIGLSYLFKTQYNPAEAIRVMDILDSADFDEYGERLDLRKYFDFPDYPFKDSWLVYESSGFIYDDGKGETDTLSTHPDCQKRKKAIARQIKDLEKRDSHPFALPALRVIADFEGLETLYKKGAYGSALYRALTLLDVYPENIYLEAMVAKSFYEIYKAQEKHNLDKVVELPDDRFEKGYNELLTFIHNLRLTEMAMLSYKFAFSRASAHSADEEFLYALILNSTLPVSKVTRDQYVKLYREQFPDGKYINRL